MKHAVWPALAVVLAACGGATVTRTASIDPAMTQYLLDSAATDFKAHGPPAHVRHARIGYSTDTDGSKHYVLCGEFQRPATTTWMFFATVKTGGYEQYLAGELPMQCRHASMAWGDDVTASLQARLAAEH